VIANYRFKSCPDYKKNKNMENQNINEKDVKHLQWLYDRMVNVHGENKDYDYMIKFKEIIEQLKK
jgi:hypothetical protein